MEEKETTISWKGKEYKLIFNINVANELQKEYGSLEKYGELTDKNNSEINIDALMTGVQIMINEGIDIDNDENHKENSFITKKQVGRMLTDLSLSKVSEKVNNAVINGYGNDEKNV